MKQFRNILPFIFLLISINVKSQNLISFTNENWTIYDGRILDFEGEKAFMGTALLNNYEFKNGTIEWDLYTTGQRSYPGIFFRMNEQQDFEHFYVRPHKTNGLNADALQYTPAYHGISCWQLYHGEGYTKEIVIPANEWVHYKLVVNGKQAKVFIKDMEVEAFTIHLLEHGISEGAILLNSPADGSAYFANFSVTDKVNCHFDKQLVKTVIPGAIYNWDVSEPITNNLIDNENYPGKNDLKNLKWKQLVADTNGMVNLTKSLIHDQVQPGWAYAKTTLVSDSSKSIWYSFGYSDYITIFLNGKAVFQGINAYTSRDPSYQGLIGYFDRVKLDLKKGENELLLLVGEQFGGWGFMFRDAQSEIVSNKLAKKWSVQNTLNYPESVAWDPQRQLLYVSNYLKGQGEYLSKLSIDGQIIEKEWIKGLNRPTALILLGDSLIAVERKSLAIIDVKSASIINRINIEGSSFLNDITATKDRKTLLIGDSDASKIFKVEDGKVSLWMEGKNCLKPNAILLNGDNLLVGFMGDSKLKSINIISKKIDILAEFFPGTIIDGIQVLKDGSLLVGDFNGIMYHMDKGGKMNELLNLSGQGINFSDFYFIRDKNLIVIPGLYSNSLLAYSFQ